MPAATSAGLNPSLNVFGAPHSLVTSAFWRGWYQKSYMNSMPPASRSHRSATEKSRASRTANPPGVLPSASPSIEIVTMSPGMQCTVCGALSPSFSLISSPSITFLIRGARGSEMSTMWIREDRSPGTIIVSRLSCEWHADEHAFQPKWCSSSPTFGISVRWTICP